MIDWPVPLEYLHWFRRYEFELTDRCSQCAHTHACMVGWTTPKPNTSAIFGGHGHKNCGCPKIQMLQALCILLYWT